MASDKGPATHGREHRGTRPFPELLRSLASDAGELVRREIALARAEIRYAARTAAKAASRVAVGAGLGGVGLLTILAGVVVLIGSLIGSYWLAALIVGGVLALVGAWSALSGVRRMRTVDPAPRQAMETTRETVSWAKDELTAMRASLLGSRRGRREALAAERGVPALPRASVETSSRPVIRRDPITPEGFSSTSAHSLQRGTEVPLRAPGSVPDRAGSARGLTPAVTSARPPAVNGGRGGLLKQVAREVQEDRITAHAASLAYYAFLAMPPALMALFGLAGLVGSERFATWLEGQAALALPPAVSETIIGPFIEEVVLNEAPGPFSIGLVLALWGGSAVFVGLIDTLNHAFDVEETRPFIRKRLLALVVMLASVLLFLLAAGALLVAPALVDMLGLGQLGTVLWNVAQWPAAFAFMVAAFWGAYYFLPNREQKRSKGVLLRAAAIAAALWVLATAIFRIYIANFGSYSDTYGFIGAFIILLLWLYVTGLVVLVGGELAAEMEKRAA